MQTERAVIRLRKRTVVRGDTVTVLGVVWTEGRHKRKQWKRAETLAKFFNIFPGITVSTRGAHGGVDVVFSYADSTPISVSAMPIPDSTPPSGG